MKYSHCDNERRLSPAGRTRLRCGQILDLSKKLVSTCTLYDLKNGTVGIVLPTPNLMIPDTMYLHDQRDLMTLLARSLWRMGQHAGISYLEKPVPLRDRARSSGLPNTGDGDANLPVPPEFSLSHSAASADPYPN